MKTDLPFSKWLLIGFIGVYSLRFVISVSMGIMPQDAYYYLYSEHLALSYFDHPPMVAYMLKLTSLFFGKSLVIVKLTDFFVSLISFFGFYHLSQLFLSRNKAMIAAVLYGVTFQLTVISINTTPDVPLMFFWTFSLVAIHKALFANKFHWWPLAGLLMGLAFCSKYTALFLPAGCVLFLLISRKHRHLLWSKELVVAILCFLLTISPIIYWNIENDWISFAFQTTERAGEISRFQLKPKFFFGNIGTQLLLLLPVLFIAMFWVYFRLIRKGILRRRLFSAQVNFLLVFSLPIIVFFFTVSIFYWVKLNWLMPGYITMIILLSIYLKKKWLSYQVVIALVLHFALLIQILWYPIKINSDDTWYGWKALADQIETLKSDYPEYFVFSADGYKTSAVLNFYMDDHVYAGNVIGKHGLQFSIIDAELDHLIRRNAIFIDSKNLFNDSRRSYQIPDQLSDCFSQVNELEPLIIRDDEGKPVRKFFVYRCLDYVNESN